MTGLAAFRDHHRDHISAYAIIGGVACRRKLRVLPISQAQLGRCAVDDRAVLPAGGEIQLRPPQQFIPIGGDEAGVGLSAILLDPEYYGLVRDNVEVIDGLPIVRTGALILLKARAYMDLRLRKQQGEPVRGGDVRKHRNDVFALAALLDAANPVPVTPRLGSDLRAFLAEFPLNAREWGDIQRSGQHVFGGNFPPPELLLAQLRNTFGVR